MKNKQIVPALSEPQRIDTEQAHQIIDTREPRGRFYMTDTGDVIIGIDNSTGEAWTEEFGNADLQRCLQWLTGAIEVDEN